MKDTKQIGDVSVAMIMAALLRSGRGVLIPFGDRHPYDLVVDDGGTFLRVQCKTGRRVADAIRFNLCSVVRDPASKKWIKRSYGGSVDAFAVYSPDTARCYLVPANKVGRVEGSLMLRPARNHKPALLADDFEIRV